MTHDAVSGRHPLPEEYLSQLNPSQQEAVIHNGSPLLILAGAGSGKTRVITTKIAYLISCKGVDPHSILAVTFTKKAALEMAERARFLEPAASRTQIKTFHSFGAWFLRLYAAEAGIDRNFTVYDDEDSMTLLRKAVPSLTKPEAAEFAHKIALAKDYCLAPDSPDLGTVSTHESFSCIYQAYQDRLRSTGNVDFGDLIMLPVQLLQNNPAVKQHMHRCFSVIMVDEYQDANTAQFLLLQQMAGPDTYICVVGDDDQSIYRFRGAEVQNILNFPRQFPGTTLIKLEQNYRSTPQILKPANEVISRNANRFDKELKAVRHDGEIPVLTFLHSQYDETTFCAEIIAQAHEKGVPYHDWAILYRTNIQSLGFETEFLHRKIPYTIVGSLKFYDREEIKDVTAYLALLANHRDEIAFERVINKPARGIGDKSRLKIIAAVHAGASPEQPPDLLQASPELPGLALPAKAASGLKEFNSLMKELAAYLEQGQQKQIPLPVEQLASEAAGRQSAPLPRTEQLSYLIQQIIEKTGLAEYHNAHDEIAGTQRFENMQELANSASLYPLSTGGLLDFLDHIELDRMLEQNESSDTDAVTLITVHNTKGLEFPRVILTGMEDGIFPRQGKNDEEIEEERRLFYVGITRAKDMLLMTSCRTRNRFGKTDEMMPSPFLLEINPGTVKLLGEIPLVFKRNPGNNQTGTEHPLASVWKKGRKIYHDDYGYGWISSTQTLSGEFTITVQFENGLEKRFLPEYQKNLLTPADEL